MKPESNIYGKITKNKSKERSSCGQCMYFDFDGKHKACWTCATEVIPDDCFYTTNEEKETKTNL